ncbi:hypothetical protein CR513_54959, partial [Mucuna pruriens]
MMQDEEVEYHTLEEDFRELEAQIPPSSKANARKKEKLKQTTIRDVWDKQTTKWVNQYIAQFWYQVGLSFNMIKLQSFHDMLAAIESFGPHLQPPSYHDIRVPLLQKELEHTNNLMKGQRESWKTFGCPIMSYAWIDRKQDT